MSQDTKHATVSDSLPKPKPGQYYCPMCPEIISDTAGRCPKCNMFLEQMPSDSITNAAYVCPMHPEITSDQPGSCSICGMDLVATPSGDTHTGHDAGVSDVPGLVPVTIEPHRLQLIGVKSETATPRALHQTVRTVGYVTPDESRLYRVQARFSGWITKLYATETGKEIRTGDPIFSVYSPELVQAIGDYRRATGATGAGSLSALTNQALRDAALERLRFMGLSDSDVRSLVTGDTSASELVIRSSYDGIVTERQITTGQKIEPGQTLLTLVDLSRVWAMAEIYETDLGRVSVGQDALLSVDAYPGEQFHGRLSFISPTISEQSRTASARLEFVNMQRRLKPGMYGSVAITTASDEVLTIPATALLDGGEHQYVFIRHGQTHFEPRHVTVGRRTDEHVEIIQGLAPGDTVVTSANFLIDSESRLQAAIMGTGATTPDHSGH